jgi:hypothetical protein
VRPSPHLIIAAVALASPWASGQQVFRCGNSYSQQACEGGASVSASDPRTPAEAQQATQAAAADAKRADAMEQARLAQDKTAPKAIVMGPPASAPVGAKPAPSGKRAKKGQPEHFTAVAPARTEPAGKK